jgi:hypothetical protein
MSFLDVSLAHFCRKKTLGRVSLFCCLYSELELTSHLQVVHAKECVHFPCSGVCRLVLYAQDGWHTKAPKSTCHNIRLSQVLTHLRVINIVVECNTSVLRITDLPWDIQLRRTRGRTSAVPRSVRTIDSDGIAMGSSSDCCSDHEVQSNVADQILSSPLLIFFVVIRGAE